MAMRTPSGCWIRVATPICLPSLSVSVAPPESGALSSIVAHPASISAALTTSARLTVECPPGSCGLSGLREQRRGRLAIPLHVVELDMLVGADLVRQLRQRHRRVVGGGAQPPPPRLSLRHAHACPRRAPT